MLRRTPLAQLALALTLVFTVSSCFLGDDSDRSDRPKAQAAEAPVLKAAWTNDEAPPMPETGLGAATDEYAGRHLWETGEILAVTTGDHVMGVDRSSGETAWTFRPKAGQHLCAVAPRPTSDGVVGLLVGGTGMCTQAVALDLTTGQTTWTRRLTPAVERVEPNVPEVTVNDSALTAHGVRDRGGCPELDRFDIATGKPLPTLVTSTEWCDDDSVEHDGSVIATRIALPAAGDVVPESAQLSLYDERSGELLWSRKTTAHTELMGIVSSDPLVLDLIDDDGRRLMREVDENGKPSRIVGPSLRGPDTALSTHWTDGLLVTDLEVSVGYDPETGDEAWRTPDRELAVGVHDEAVVTSAYIEKAAASEREPGEPINEVWLVRRDPGSDPSPQVLGRLPDAESSGGNDILGTQLGHLVYGIAGDLLVTQTATGLVAYQLPDDGTEELYARVAADGDLGWADGDVRPEEALGACDAVRAETLTLVNADPELPPTASCAWHIDADEDPALDIGIEVSKPAGAESASEVAAKSAEALIDLDDDFEPIEGLGDQAWVSRGRPTYAYQDLIVRSGNVVVRATARETWLTPSEDNRPHLPPIRVEQAAHDAVRDVFSHLGTDLAEPAQRDTGAVTKVLDACQLAAAEAAALLPGATLERTTYQPASPRQSECSWHNEIYEHLTVETYATPGGLTGRSAAEEASTAFDVEQPGRQIKDLGEQAVIESVSLMHDGAEVTARYQNLLVIVSYERDRGVSDRDIEAAAVRVARKVLAAYN